MSNCLFIYFLYELWCYSTGILAFLVCYISKLQFLWIQNYGKRLHFYLQYGLIALRFHKIFLTKSLQDSVFLFYLFIYLLID